MRGPVWGRTCVKVMVASGPGPNATLNFPMQSVSGTLSGSAPGGSCWLKSMRISSCGDQATTFDRHCMPGEYRSGRRESESVNNRDRRIFGPAQLASAFKAIRLNTSDHSIAEEVWKAEYRHGTALPDDIVL